MSFPRRPLHNPYRHDGGSSPPNNNPITAPTIGNMASSSNLQRQGEVLVPSSPVPPRLVQQPTTTTPVASAPNKEGWIDDIPDVEDNNTYHQQEHQQQQQLPTSRYYHPTTAAGNHHHYHGSALPLPSSPSYSAVADNRVLTHQGEEGGIGHNINPTYLHNISRNEGEGNDDAALRPPLSMAAGVGAAPLSTPFSLITNQLSETTGRGYGVTPQAWPNGVNSLNFRRQYQQQLVPMMSREEGPRGGGGAGDGQEDTAEETTHYFPYQQQQQAVGRIPPPGLAPTMGTPILQQHYHQEQQHRHEHNQQQGAPLGHPAPIHSAPARGEEGVASSPVPAAAAAAAAAAAVESQTTTTTLAQTLKAAFHNSLQEEIVKPLKYCFSYRIIRWAARSLGTMLVFDAVSPLYKNLIHPWVGAPVASLMGPALNSWWENSLLYATLSTVIAFVMSPLLHLMIVLIGIISVTWVLYTHWSANSKKNSNNNYNHLPHAIPTTASVGVTQHYRNTAEQDQQVGREGPAHAPPSTPPARKVQFSPSPPGEAAALVHHHQSDDGDHSPDPAHPAMFFHNIENNVMVNGDNDDLAQKKTTSRGTQSPPLALASTFSKKRASPPKGNRAASVKKKRVSEANALRENARYAFSSAREDSTN